MAPTSKKRSPKTGNDEDAVLDALAGALRTWGELAIEIAGRSEEEIQQDFEGWARHAVLASPRPGLDDPSTPPANQKDWNGLGRFVREHRRAEYDFVTRSLDDLRQVIWQFIQSLGQAISEDRQADGEVAAKMLDLRRAVESNDTEVLKREALSSISLIQSRIEGRKIREQGQIDDLSDQVNEMASELVEVKEQLSVDALTEVCNRAGLDRQVSRVVSLGLVLRQPAILFMIDVDHFKWVNDRYGHAAGDDVLRQVAARLSVTFRRKGDFLARYGGDEFSAVILEDSLETANRIGDRLLFAIRELDIPCEGEDEPIRVSVSIGAARLEPGENARSWFDRADRALYQAKELGRDRIALAIDTIAPEASEPTQDEEG
ncbi:MAG: GGDEF domain-containing protein [bacterium]|nr:GGDEF domain-containing protein [bacterium]